MSWISWNGHFLLSGAAADSNWPAQPLAAMEGGNVLEFVGICLKLEFVGICWNLLEFVGICWKLLEFVGMCWNVLEVVGI